MDKPSFAFAFCTDRHRKEGQAWSDHRFHLRKSRARTRDTAPSSLHPGTSIHQEHDHWRVAGRHGTRIMLPVDYHSITAIAEDNHNAAENPGMDQTAFEVDQSLGIEADPHRRKQGILRRCRLLATEGTVGLRTK